MFIVAPGFNTINLILRFQVEDTFGPHLGRFWPLWLSYHTDKCPVGQKFMKCIKSGPHQAHTSHA